MPKKLLLSHVLLQIFLCISPLSADNLDSYTAVFTNIYEKAVWGVNDQGEGFSGGGSLLHCVRPYLQFIKQFMQTHNIHTVVDAGCGDWESSKHIDWTGIEYVGYDVVTRIINKNIARYERPNIHFVNANFITTDLPPADLLICKHVLQHLPNDDVQQFLRQLPKFKYCIITNDVDPYTLSSRNRDIPLGAWRTIDISQPPFNITCIKAYTYFMDNVPNQIILVDNSACI